MRRLWRSRPVNWLRARPWEVWPLFPRGWRYQNIYRSHRTPFTMPSGRHYPALPRWRAAWRALCFPHTHEEGEE